MKCLYIYYDLSQQTGEAVGIIKKIFAQQKILDKKFDEGCDILNLPLRGSKNKISRFFKYLFFRNAFDLSLLKGKKYDSVYIRRITPNSRSVIQLLQYLKNNNPNCKIVYEIPTYPYDFEHKSFISKLSLLIDKLYRKKLHYYVDKIATLTDDETIFNCSTIKISNGVDVDSIPICEKKDFDSNNINLIAVAQFSFWHGFERVIEGLSHYYKTEKECKVTLHLVGNGPELEKYKKLIDQYMLNDYIIIHGALYGEKLNEVFNIADIALCSLACHRINIYIASELKSREYLCRGLPIVTSTKIDILPDNFMYALRIPEDDSDVDINSIVEFGRRLYIYSNLEKKRKTITNEIRYFAEENCNMEKALKNVLEFFL